MKSKSNRRFGYGRPTPPPPPPPLLLLSVRVYSVHSWLKRTFGHFHIVFALAHDRKKNNFNFRKENTL